MDEGKVTPIDKARTRRGDQVVPPEKRSEKARHLPPDATRSQVRRAGKVTAAKRRSDVLTLAVAGHPPAAIAETLTAKYKAEGLSGVSQRSVEITINKALEEWRASDASKIENVREMQLARLNQLLTKLYPKALGADGQPHLKTVDRVLKLEQLRSKIAGTEAPRKLEVSGSIGLGLDPKEIEREEQAWLASGGSDVIDVDPRDVEEVTTNAP